MLNYDFYARRRPNATQIDCGSPVRQDRHPARSARDRNNQFQDKVRKGKYQVFWLGWNADYPDAENFMFLLYGPAGKTKHDGENTSNYASPAYDKLFRQMKTLEDGPAKQQLIDEMVALVREDAPWTMGFFPYASAAAQQWVHNYKPAILIRDHGRFLRVDVDQRLAAQRSGTSRSGGDRFGRSAAAVVDMGCAAPVNKRDARTRAARCCHEGAWLDLNYLRRVVYAVWS